MDPQISPNANLVNAGNLLDGIAAGKLPAPSRDKQRSLPSRRLQTPLVDVRRTAGATEDMLATSSRDVGRTGRGAGSMVISRTLCISSSPESCANSTTAAVQSACTLRSVLGGYRTCTPWYARGADAGQVPPLDVASHRGTRRWRGRGRHRAETASHDWKPNSSRADIQFGSQRAVGTSECAQQRTGVFPCLLCSATP